MNRKLWRWVNMGLTSWGSIQNEVFNSHHGGESREGAQLLLNREEKCKGKRLESGPRWTAVWPSLPSYPEEAPRRARGQRAELRRLPPPNGRRGRGMRNRCELWQVDRTAAPCPPAAITGSATPGWFEVFVEQTGSLWGRPALPTGNWGHCTSTPRAHKIPLCPQPLAPRPPSPGPGPGLETYVDSVGSRHSRWPWGPRRPRLSWQTSLKTQSGQPSDTAGNWASRGAPPP